MKEEFQTYCDAYIKLFPHATSEELDVLRSQLIIKEYGKKEFFFSCGDVQKNMGYVCKGLLRRYYINEKGNRITTGFVKENEYATDYPAFIRQKPTKYFMECLEPSIIIELSYVNIQEGYKRFKNNEMYGRLTAEYVLTVQTDRVESFLFENAEERYLNFLNQNPDIIHRISLTHLSSYLGIERQSLSRIRSKIAKK
ncbi:Crp/Fnr family transcriptional regulator [Maribacter polysiphoniae]|uniref:CRP-like cAMP-binding protein n=1 Tax=Maribacter polysiphoniae TaxID=429344 RepID=A0A316EE17_9FLAO|nr:Crp/Fnr family transcriptional regulator [Maribacter polysiphoniae]MBD1262582.1 Crp/Fnr family transcriptional regulator [Maribacter polysiphoniae]PWK21220.1 CRP-like cAMP-binding protein [Maribacter polysiphoniae]